MKYFIAAIPLLFLASCADRPDVGALADSIYTSSLESDQAQISQEFAQCLSISLIGSELSDTTLSGLADDFTDSEVLATEVNLVPELIEQFSLDCATSLPSTVG